MKLSAIASMIDSLPHRERIELGRKLDWFEAVVASFAGDVQDAVGSIYVPTATPEGNQFVGIFKAACPSGWTRESTFDGKTLYGASAYGATGGTAAATVPSHTHSISNGGEHTHSYNRYVGSTGVGAGAATTVLYGTGSYTTGAASAAHNHGGNTGSSGTADAEGNWPPYVKVVFCSKD